MSSSTDSDIQLPLHPLWFNRGSTAEEIIEDVAASEETKTAIDSFYLLNHVEAWMALKDEDPFERVMFLTERALAVNRRAKRLAENNIFAKYLRHYTYTVAWLSALLSDMERIASKIMEQNKSEDATQDAAPSSPLPSTPTERIRRWEDIVSPTPAENEHANAKYGKNLDDDDAN